MSDNDTIDLEPLRLVLVDSGVVPPGSTDVIIDYFINAGIEKVEDLKYIKERDLEGILPIIKRRKLVDFIEKLPGVTVESCSNAFDTNNMFVSEIIEFPLDQLPECSEDAEEVTPASLLSVYEFPWNLIPAKMKKWLGTRRPTPKEKTHFVSIVMNDITEYHSHPTRNYLRPIAKQLTEMFAKSFQVVSLSGEPLQSGEGGYFSLLKHMEQRASNRRRPQLSSGSSSESTPKRKKSNDYVHGMLCKQWNPPVLESDEDIESARLSLVAFYQKNNWECEESKTKLKKCLPTVRMKIKAGEIGVEKITQDWPLFFTKIGIHLQYDDLVHGESLDNFITNYMEYLPKLLNYLMAIQGKYRQMQIVAKDIVNAKKMVKNNQPEVFGLLKMLAVFFKENTNEIFRTDEHSRNDLPVTPCIIALGDTVLTATRYKVTLDSKIVCTGIKSSEEAIAIFFAIFFIFGIKYPASIALTMEFLEREVGKIRNTGRGRGKGSTTKGCVGNIPKQILKLLDGLQDHAEL